MMRCRACGMYLKFRSRAIWGMISFCDSGPMSGSPSVVSFKGSHVEKDRLLTCAGAPAR
jgi:hypothetical protein